MLSYSNCLHQLLTNHANLPFHMIEFTSFFYLYKMLTKVLFSYSFLVLVAKYFQCLLGARSLQPNIRKGFNEASPFLHNHFNFFRHLQLEYSYLQILNLSALVWKMQEWFWKN